MKKVSSGKGNEEFLLGARWHRNSTMGAGSYTVPLDASPKSCDWRRFLGTAPNIRFNAEHFFQWRKRKAYSTALQGIFSFTCSRARTSSLAATVPPAP
jgi:hypothetical protein